MANMPKHDSAKKPFLIKKYFTFWWAFERNETRSNPLSQLWQIDPQSAINLKPDNFFQQRISFLPNVRRSSMLLCVACVVSAFTVFWFSLTAVVGQLVSTGRGSSMKIHPQETVIKMFFSVENCFNDCVQEAEEDLGDSTIPSLSFLSTARIDSQKWILNI